MYIATGRATSKVIMSAIVAGVFVAMRTIKGCEYNILSSADLASKIPTTVPNIMNTEWTTINNALGQFESVSHLVLVSLSSFIDKICSLEAYHTATAG